MSAKPRRWWLGALPLFLVCVGVTCGTKIGVEPRGDLQDGVNFRLWLFGKEERSVSLREIEVGELYGEVVWKIRGSATLADFAYGESIGGLEVLVEPRPLRPNAAYYIAVSGGARGRQDYGTASFDVDEDGRVRVPAKREAIDP